MAPGRDQHDQDAATRRADEGRMLDVEGGEDGEDVLRFGDDVVVAPVAVVVRLAAPAIVDRHHAARLFRMAGQRQSKVMEIADGPRQSGQADHGRTSGVVGRVVAYMDANGILGADEAVDIGRAFAGGLTRLGHAA